MEDSKKDKAQLIEELSALRLELAEARAAAEGSRDLSELRRAEQALREENHFVEAVLDSMIDTVFVFEPATGQAIRWNRAFRETSGFTDEEIAARKAPDDWYAEEDLRSAAETVAGAVTEGDARVELGLVTKSGAKVPTEYIARPLSDAEGNPRYIVSIGRDLTDRHRTDKALRSAEAKVLSAFDDLMEGCQLIGFDWRYLYVNRAAVRQSRLAKEQLLGRTMLEALPGIEHTELFALLQRVMAERVPQKTENRYQYADGSIGWFELIIQPVDEGIFILSIDVTSRRRAESAAARLEEQLLQSQKMEALGTLAGGVAHDMNNVLAVILGLSSLLERDADKGHDDARYAQEIGAAARRGRSLVQNLLGFARKGKYQRESVSLNETVEELMQVLGPSIPKKVTLRVTLDEHLRRVECDPAQLMQMLMNLCLNANDALDGMGTITISTRNEALGAGDVTGLEAGDFVNVRVEDDGPGMGEETRKRAFEPFFTTKDVGRGTGLGLSMAYGVVENHGGAIRIDSEVGRGTVVSMWFPVSQAEAPGDDDEAGRQSPTVTQTAAGAMSAAGTEGAARRATVLLVDDEAMVRTTAGRMLEFTGHEVVLASSGQEALDAYRTRGGQIDLVILDISMPVMDGAECFAKLRELDAGARVLICTGHGKSRDTEQMVARGALGVVRKPFDLDQLTAAIEGALGHES